MGKLAKGILLGVAVGTAVALLNKERRQRAVQFLEDVKQDPGIVVDKVRENIADAKETFDDFREDIDYVKTKVESLRETVPFVKEFIDDFRGVIQEEKQ